jgi:hypothetical protein
MSPSLFLLIAVFVTAAAAITNQILRGLHQKRLRKIAAEWEMNYSPTDQFRLKQRIARNFPVPGAARIRIADLIYGIENEEYRFVFTAEYTAGVISGKRRVLRAGSLSELRGRVGDLPVCKVTLAPANLPLLEQYRKLKPNCAREGERQ